MNDELYSRCPREVLACVPSGWSSSWKWVWEGRNDLGYMRWSNWLFWFLLSPNWLSKWSVCSMSSCPWLFPYARVRIYTKSHGLCFPAVRSLYPQNKKEKWLLNRDDVCHVAVRFSGSCVWPVMKAGDREEEVPVNGGCKRRFSCASVYALHSAGATLLRITVIFRLRVSPNTRHFRRGFHSSHSPIVKLLSRG